MKTMIHILIVLGFLVSTLTVQANVWSEQPNVQMHSTSAMLGSGSSLPQAAVTGTCITSDESSQAMSGPRRIIDEEDKNDKETDGWAEPGLPFGDALLPFLLLAAGYVMFLARKRSAHAIKRR